MDCRSCEKYINEYLDNELSKEKEELLQKHITNCQSCKEEFDRYRIMNHQLKEMEELSPREGFEEGILSRLGSFSQVSSKEEGERESALEVPSVEVDESKRMKENRRKDLILVFAYFFTLFVVLNVLRNIVFQNVDWISGVMVTGRVFREVFDGWIFRGLFALLVVYPIRLFHWTGTILGQMSLEGRLIYSLVLMNLLLIITFSHRMLRNLAKGRGKNIE